MAIVLDGTTGVTLPDGNEAVGFATGTKMMFQQTAAPTGWVKDTAHDNKALRVVSGTASTGGSVAFTTAFASGLSAGNTTLATTQISSHAHSASIIANYSTAAGPFRFSGYAASNGSLGSASTDAAGGGQAHNHTIPSFAVAYVDLIIAAKD
jgi:hypothetical protein